MLPHSPWRPVRLLSVMALLIGVSLLAGTVPGAASTGPGEMSGLPAMAIGYPEAGHPVPSAGPTVSGLPSELTDTSWRLDAYSSDGFLTPVLDDSVVTATFERDGTVNGHASCNSYLGPYRVLEFAISIGPLLTTRMACERDVMDQEQAYLDALESAETYSVQASTLTLADAGGLPLAIFGRSLLSTVAPASDAL